MDLRRAQDLIKGQRDFIEHQVSLLDGWKEQVREARHWHAFAFVSLSSGMHMRLYHDPLATHTCRWDQLSALVVR